MSRPVHPPSSDLTDLLIANDSLHADDPLTDAFRHVDRGALVPAFAVYEHTPHGTRYRLIRRDDPEQYDEWASRVYADETPIIEIKGEPVIDALPAGTGKGRWTSSSTMPGLMVQMLTELDLTEDVRVLEIGVGSGYNAALLCERLGSDQVTSIDISSRLVSDAAERLNALGYRPVLATFDGHQAIPTTPHTTASSPRPPSPTSPRMDHPGQAGRGDPDQHRGRRRRGDAQTPRRRRRHRPRPVPSAAGGFHARPYPQSPAPGHRR
ncbi:methyltransferase domain-containing protein [Allosalinactinospora lopnorensis]|uniref:methyltransferase domain-containing protein n=1 Tax=Allosalinactinospora lopnorensis TaxID=1352348 RepID=UPI001F427CC8|nr:methyltransferase domain-containing protein [Allosalinactinospora lopnorensis]